MENFPAKDTSAVVNQNLIAKSTAVVVFMGTGIQFKVITREKKGASAPLSTAYTAGTEMTL